MKRLGLLLPALLLLNGCETLNEALVRQIHKDSGLSRRINRQIQEGLEKRTNAPKKVPTRPAPPNMDQG